MGLIAVLVTTVIIVLIAIFSFGGFSGGEKKDNLKQAENQAQQVTDTVNEKARLEYEQQKKLDNP